MILLASDMDGTMLPNSDKSYNLEFYSVFNQWIEDRRNKIKIVYITGRDFPLALEGIKKYPIPYPDIIVSDVGSSIYMYAYSKWKRSTPWDKKLMDRFAEAGIIKNHLKSIPSITLQEEDKQTPYKISYYSSPSISEEKLILDIKNTLNTHNISAKIIFSIDHKTQRGLLDILPSNSGKKNALDFIVNSLSIEKYNVLFAGDTGNDLEVLISSYKSVLVGNAEESFRKRVLDLAQKNKTLETTFSASYPYAEGIAEALYHFGFTKKEIK